jgi:uncharacterized LabA/DUF88 family protein
MNWIEQMYHIEKWKKYSQSHEEAYLLHIFSNLKLENGFLVELGAWDGYHLSNTRYFIENGWDAILIDGDNRGNNEVKQHFIDAENVISIFKKYSTPKEFDFLCIDLDGNDIYILEKILTEFSPKVIVAEFNPYFKKGDSKTITYDPNHTWNKINYEEQKAFINCGRSNNELDASKLANFCKENNLVLKNIKESVDDLFRSKLQ